MEMYPILLRTASSKLDKMITVNNNNNNSYATVASIPVVAVSGE